MLVQEAGPEHSKTFTVEVRLKSNGEARAEFVGRAQGSTKKMAEQDAARQLLSYLGVAAAIDGRERLTRGSRRRKSKSSLESVSVKLMNSSNQHLPRAFVEPASAAGSHSGRTGPAGRAFRRVDSGAHSGNAGSAVHTRLRPPPAARWNLSEPPKLAATDVSGSLQSLLGTVVIAVFVITFIVQAFQIPSPSMENTLLVGDYLLVNKLVLWRRQRRAIISCRIRKCGAATSSSFIIR